jgi:archaetidylinositol phosphate synthase
MLNKLREMLEPYNEKIGYYFAKLGLSPTTYTFLALLTSIFASLFYTKPFGSMQFIAGILLLVSGFMDIVDGAVARVTKKVTKKGAFIDSTTDRLSEIFIFLGIFLGELAEPWIVLSALSFSLLVSYSRARGESLGVSVFGVGIGERAERMIVLALFSLVSQISLGVIIVLILALITFIQRTIHVLQSL